MPATGNDPIRCPDGAAVVFDDFSWFAADAAYCSTDGQPSGMVPFIAFESESLVIPPLSLEDAQVLASAVFALLAVAFVWRQLRRVT